MFMAVKEKIILGVDPGTNFTGYGILEIKDNRMSVVALGVINLRKDASHFLKLKRIFDRILSLIDSYHPDELAIEAPFYGKNVQSMLKLGRAQGAAIAAGLHRELPVFEYAPRKIKMAITGKGDASKEQVSAMLMHILHFREVPDKLDATDALAAAVCHHFQHQSLTQAGHAISWKDFIRQNKDRITD
ncbi:MAG TPA: crossover junction endodeoxyribonuclease RuvC [Bacteroidetes bacterium]|nr:crossover junction endodeoxyribonuclease RuvC [Bacteroidota bacterium]